MSLMDFIKIRSHCIPEEIEQGNSRPVAWTVDLFGKLDQNPWRTKRNLSKRASDRYPLRVLLINYSLVFTTKKIVQGSSWPLSGPRWIDSSLDLKNNMKIRTRGLQTRSGWLLKTWRGGGGYDRLVNTRTIFHALLRTSDLCCSLAAPISCSCMKAHVCHL